MADNINSENINEYIKSHSQKIKRLENNSSTKTVNELPTNSQGDNGDIYIVKDKNRSYLVFKSNNVWNEVSSDLLIRGTQNTGQSNNQSDTIDGYDHDSGWIDATDSNDSDTLGTPVNPKGIYRITHNMGATLLSGEVFCRFEALNNGQVRTYTINLNSSSSYPGPNANRYGYWIEIIDSNNVDLHVYPDGLGILYSDRFKDSSNNTSVLLSSNDTQNIASLEVRVFLKKIVNNKGKKPLLHYSNPKKNPFSGKRKNGKVLGKSVVGDKGASVDGTKNSSFKIDSDGTGVLLKNDSGVLKVRNIADDGDVQINASKLVVSAEAAATNEIGKSSVSNKFLSTHDGSALYNTLMMNSSGVVENNPAGGNVIFVDDRFLFADNADNTKTCFFQLSGITSGAGRTLTIPDADGTIALTSDVVTNHITNNAADVMTVSDFGANAALKIDADQPATAGAENSIGLQIDYDRAVATSGTAGHNDIGIDLDVNTATLGTGTAWGMDIDVTGATSGTHTAIGADIAVSGADTNIGIIINSPSEHIRMQASADAVNDYATLSVADTGDLTIATVGNGTTDSDLTLDVDGDINMDAAGGDINITSCDVNIAATKGLYLDGGGDTYIYEQGADALRIVVGGDNIMHMTESGDDGNAILMDSCAGFVQKEPTYDATTTVVDFRHSNKQFVTFGAGSITNVNLFFPLVSGNFILLVKQDGTGSRTITNYKVYEFDESAADGHNSIKWAGGTQPTLTTDANHVDILSFYWDADNEIAYGTATLDFQF